METKILTFERGRDVKTALDLGIAKNLPGWMKDSPYHFNSYREVWYWAISEGRNFMFPYIVERRGKKWFNEETIIMGMGDNNSLLWDSVSQDCLPAVKAILVVEDLFAEEAFTLKLGAAILKETFIRGYQEIPYRSTSFGAFVQLAMTQAHGNFELQDALMNYYRKYSKDAI